MKLYKMDRQSIMEVLREEQYPEHMIEQTISKLEKLSPQVKRAFEKWLDNGHKPSLAIEGFKFSDLTDRYGMVPVGAFLTLDWLVREPKTAKEKLIKGIA